MPRRAQAEDRHWQHPCCGKVHGPKSAEKKDDQTGGGKKADSEDSECKSGNPHSTPEVEEYSQEDDATIVKMKNEKATWLMILDAIGKKSQSQLQAHWRRDLQARADKDRTKGDEERAKAEKEPARQGAHKDRISRAKTEEKVGDCLLLLPTPLPSPHRLRHTDISGARETKQPGRSRTSWGTRTSEHGLRATTRKSGLQSHRSTTTSLASASLPLRQKGSRKERSALKIEGVVYGHVPAGPNYICGKPYHRPFVFPGQVASNVSVRKPSGLVRCINCSSSSFASPFLESICRRSDVGSFQPKESRLAWFTLLSAVLHSTRQMCLWSLQGRNLSYTRRPFRPA